GRISGAHPLASAVDRPPLPGPLCIFPMHFCVIILMPWSVRSSAAPFGRALMTELGADGGAVSACSFPRSPAARPVRKARYQVPAKRKHACRRLGRLVMEQIGLKHEATLDAPREALRAEEDNVRCVDHSGSSWPFWWSVALFTPGARATGPQAAPARRRPPRSGC